MNPNQNTPKTISEKEQETLAFWQENTIFEKSVTSPAGNTPTGQFSFYDGPPFATGLPHYGHILAGTIKDAIPRYQTMQGKSVRRVWGWDCHGLPIENLIEKKLGLASKKDIEDFGIDKFNRDAYESVLQYEREWKNIVPRLGRWVDMDHAYKTMDATYTESIWWAWKSLYEKGLAYEGNKMMHICPRCETTLAQSEVGMEYHDVTDLSVTAKFELVDEPGTFVLAWTTTPWTLPGNTALALKEDAEYVQVTISGMEGSYILAKERVAEVLKDMSYEIQQTYTGKNLVGKTYKPVFPYFIDKEIENKENIWKIWHADFITLDTGTGIAHEAPAFGADDMELAKLHNIPVIKHVKMDGTFIPAVTDFAGMKVKVAGDTQSADIEIIKYLAHNSFLFEKHKIIHSYPLCWRCKTPLLNYATSSWFVDVPQIKEKLIAENQKIGWVPAHTRDGRFGKWLEGAREWAVSRTRYWGAPLPVWKSDDGDVKVIGSLEELAQYNTAQSKNTYYVMRHGESESNVAGVIDCDGDHTNSLTEKGIQQAKAAAHDLPKIDLIVSSPFLRTQQTAQEVSATLGGVEIVTDERLREFNLGIFDGKPMEEYSKSHPSVTLDTTIPEGETHRELLQRVLQAWHDLEEKYAGKTILIVTHGGPGWMLLAGTSLKTDSEINKDMLPLGAGKWLPNAHPVRLEIANVPRDETGAINLHRPYIDEVKLSIDGKIYKRIPDVFDCWFESGSMPFASLHYPFENKDIFEKNYPADFIAEGVDQTRGWFYSLINLGVGLFDKAPYKHVIVNGLVLAESGAKLSKSEKNYSDPMLMVEKYGADAIRYALLSSPVVKGENILFTDASVEDIYKKLISRLENVVVLYQMNKPESVIPKNTSTNVLDIWMISRVHELVRNSTQGYEEYKLDDATRYIADTIDDISVWYTRRSRERLKGDAGEQAQMEAYETLTYILQTLAKVMAPVMPFIAERIYQQTGGEKESVHLEKWPQGGTINEQVLGYMAETRKLVSEALMKRTEHGIPVRQPLAQLTIATSLTSEYLEIIKSEINVKEISNGAETSLDTTITDDLRTEGDMRNLMRAIQDARKEKNFSPKDAVTLMTTYAVPEVFKAELIRACNIKEITSGEGTRSIELSSGKVFFDVV